MSRSRKDRVATAIHHEMTGLVQSAMNDPRLGFVTVTGVDLSQDLRHAKVFVSILGSESARASSLEALASAAGYLRRELAHRLNMRRTPDLQFHLDVSGDHGERIEQLLQDVGLGHGSPALEEAAEGEDPEEDSPLPGEEPDEPES
jgi:ribosome-binding factor A